MTEITQAPTVTMPNSVRRKIWRTLREVVLMIFVVVLAIVITRTMVENIAVSGVSMYPTLRADERVLVNKAVYWVGEPQRGDVVVAYTPEQQTMIVKRIIGLPGDELVIAAGEAYINGQLLTEPYVPPTDYVPALAYPVPTAADIAKGDGHWLIPAGSYFVLGDDRNFSSDSRDFGPITADAIKGKVQLLVWPPARWSMVTHHSGR